MQLRRTLIAFAVVLLAVSVGAAITAPRDEKEAPRSRGPVARNTAPGAQTLTLAHPVRGEPPVRRARVGAHVVLRVTAAVAGNVEIPGLGLLQAIAPGAPAVFDLLTRRPGRYDVTLVNVAGERTKLGTLAVE